MKHSFAGPQPLLTPPRSLDIASRIYFVVLIGGAGLVLSAWVFRRMDYALGLLPALFLLFLLQMMGTYRGSQFGTMLSGLTQLGVALASAVVFCFSVLFLFVWRLAPILAFGSLVLGYASYWMAWQNWVWVQRLRGIEEDRLLLPKTLSLLQIMLLTAMAAAICGVASMTDMALKDSP